MFHNSQAVLAVSLEPNPTIFQKTIALNDFYFGMEGFEFPMASSLPSDAVDKVAHNVLQCGYRGQAHEQGDKAANITILDREVDVKKQHESIVALLANVEQRIAVSSNDRGKRHPHRTTQHVRDRGQACSAVDVPHD